MARQIILGTEERPVKYHGMVKFVVFECNNCHNNFSKQESYFRKQLKTRESACCFCSAKCRTSYIAKKTFINKAYKPASKTEDEVEHKSSSNPISRFFSGFLRS
jgi:hypothetical protein